MKGLDLHRGFFNDCGKPLLMQAFAEEFAQLAVASVGCGSDRLGADDEYSKDHCWEPGFQIFSDRLPLERLKEIESYLFEHLPWEYGGFKRSDCLGSTNGIRAWTIDEFFSNFTSFANPPTQDRQWLLITDEALYHVTNGEVFYDPSGHLTRRRAAFGAFPENVWRFKLAGRAMRISVLHYEAQRCAAHGETLAADLLLSEGVREMLHFVCLVNKRYAPNDRWLPWVARHLPILADAVCPLIAHIHSATDLQSRLERYAEIESVLAEYVYDNGLAARGDRLWIDLRQAIAGDLKDFPVPGWIGVEYRYSSQFALGDFRKLLE